jgi:hypothetical protein
LTVVLITNDPRIAKNGCALRFGTGQKEGVKPLAIEVPSFTIGTKQEVIITQRFVPPRGAAAQARLVTLVNETIPHAELFKH